jgi:DUF1009 family protein
MSIPERKMKLGLISGTGDIPRLIAEHREANGEETFIIAIKGYLEDWQKKHPHVICGIAETGKMLNGLREAGCDTVTLIGNVKRPDFGKLKPDMKALSLLPKVLKAASQGDDALLRSMVEIFESEGFNVVGAEELLDELKPKAGILTDRAPEKRDISDIEFCYHIAGEIGKLDIGQGAVVANGLVLAVEAQEGTDEMLRRIPRLPENIRGSEDKRVGVLLKRPKPIQERRVDTPVIGPSTVRNAAEAGLSTIAVVENGALMVNKAELVDLANRYGLSIVCLQEDGKMP